MAMGRCKGCKEAIVWGRTERDKGLPLNPSPSAKGDMIDTGDRSPTGEVIVRPARHSGESDTTSPRYENHFQTCSASDNWRRN